MLEVDLSEDFFVYASLKHLKYALINVLHFIHSSELEDITRLWLSHEGRIHIRLEGRALSTSFVNSLFSLFPPKEDPFVEHNNLAISRLLMEAHCGRLLCNLHTMPNQSYTEFVLEIPLAESQPLN